MPTQRQSGKAFEFALINEASHILKGRGFVTNLIADPTYNDCLACFNIFPTAKQLRYTQAARAAINHIITLEPRLINPSIAGDVLDLQLQPDFAGQTGDVRDILFVRSSQSWEIGISAKNNHKALKHSRLSKIKDFGDSWVNVPCSQTYFANIAPIFTHLSALKSTGTMWKNVPNKAVAVYQPVLDAFRTELMAIDSSNPNIPQTLISYLVGRNDFYKVMKRAKVVEIMAFNLNNTLGKSINGVRSVTKIPTTMPPTTIVRFQLMPGTGGTLEMICDGGWTISFRIHSAETLVVPSLKFDVNLTGAPSSMYAHHIPY